MITSSFVYEFTVVPPPGDTNQPVTVDVDMSGVFVTPQTQVVLEYLGLSGMRNNAANPLVDSGSFSARLIGNINSNNTPVFTIAVPRLGDSIAAFDGIAFSSENPYIPNDIFSTILIPQLFQIEFFPSSGIGNAVDDKLTMFFTIGYTIIP